MDAHQGRSLRVGLVGAGFIGELRARALSRLPGASLVAIADPDAEALRRAGRWVPGASQLPAAELLFDRPDIDAVCIATPPAAHEPLALAALSAGKHVFCEKPLAVTVGSCDRILAAARQCGLTVATGFNLRFTRAARVARRLLDEGAIGRLDHVRGFHGHPGGTEFTHPWISNPVVAGGGALLDNGSHLIDLCRWFLGDVVDSRGFATGHTRQLPGCEDNGFLLLRNAAGNVATLQASWTEWRGYGYRVEIYGSEGYLRFGYPPMWLVHGRRREGRRSTTRRHVFPGYQIAERVRGWRWGLVESLAAEMTAWAEALVHGQPLPVTGFDGREAVRLAHAAYASEPVVRRPRIAQPA